MHETFKVETGDVISLEVDYNGTGILNQRII